MTDKGDIARVYVVDPSQYAYAFVVPASDPPHLIGPVFQTQAGDGSEAFLTIVDAAPYLMNRPAPPRSGDKITDRIVGALQEPATPDGPTRLPADQGGPLPPRPWTLRQLWDRPELLGELRPGEAELILDRAIAIVREGVAAAKVDPSF